MANDIPFDRNAPINDHFMYVDTKNTKPVLSLMLERAIFQNLTTMHLHDNLWNFINLKNHRDINKLVTQ